MHHYDIRGENIHQNQIRCIICAQMFVIQNTACNQKQTFFFFYLWTFQGEEEVRRLTIKTHNQKEKNLHVLYHTQYSSKHQLATEAGPFIFFFFFLGTRARAEDEQLICSSNQRKDHSLCKLHIFTDFLHLIVLHQNLHGCTVGQMAFVTPALRQLET